MSNVISLPLPKRQDGETRLSRLASAFCNQRRTRDDVFWLKENAEFLGIVCATDIELSDAGLASFEPFYDGIEEKLRFFPQYYRFLLSICLDLEDLGMPGDKGERLCAWIASIGQDRAEMSDLQRAEARRLLARRGVSQPVSVGDLAARLHSFMERPETFAMPNRKATYELTHIVFYLSEYGRNDPNLSEAALTSLEYAGLLAYLDQDADLLAEICTALRFAGQSPSRIWEQMVTNAHRGFMVAADPSGDLNDGYHEYLVTGWAQLVTGRPAFAGEIADGSLRFSRPVTAQGALRSLSESMYELGENRSGDWDRMRAHVLPYLGQGGHEILQGAEQSTDKFAAFFEGFSRAAAM